MIDDHLLNRVKIMLKFYYNAEEAIHLQFMYLAA